MALPHLATDDVMHAFIYSLKPWQKGFINVQAQAMADASLNEAMLVELKPKKR